MCDRHQHRVRSPSVRASPNFFYQLTTGWVKRLQGTQSKALFPALWDWITGIELGAFQFADHEQLQADGAAAQDEDSVAGGDARLLNGFDDGIDGLDESGFFETDVVREWDNAAVGHPGHGFYILSEAAAVGREAGGQPGCFVLLALGEEALLAIKASPARDMVEAHNPVAGRPLVDAPADGDDGAGKLVAQNLRRLDVTLKDFLDVRAANAAGGHFNEQFAFADFGDGDFLDADDSCFAENTCPHGFRDGPERLQRFCRCAEAAHVAETSSTPGWATFVQFAEIAEI